MTAVAPTTEKAFKVEAPLFTGVSAVGSLAMGPSDVGLAAVGALDPLAGAGGDEGSSSGEEAGVVEVEEEDGEVAGAVSDEDVDGTGAALLDACGLAAGAVVVSLSTGVGVAAAGVEVGDDDDDDGEVFGDAAGELVGASAETNPTMATKMRANATN